MLCSLLTEFGKCCCAEVHAPRAQRQNIISFAADTVLHGTSADDGVHTDTARYLGCSVAAWSVITLDAYFVVMLCFKFVYAVLCGILRYLSFIVSS